MTTKEMIEVMKAYDEGKQIQARHCDSYNWEDCKAPVWGWGAYYYRVKPEEPKDEYRPFKDVDELITYWEKHYMQSKLPPNTKPLIWVRNPKKRAEGLIYAFFENESVYIAEGFGLASLKDLFAKWTFLDGKPCGVKVEKKEIAPMLNDVNNGMLKKVNCATCKYNGSNSDRCDLCKWVCEKDGSVYQYDHWRAIDGLSDKSND